jgi:hypothetical protein
MIETELQLVNWFIWTSSVYFSILKHISMMEMVNETGISMAADTQRSWTGLFGGNEETCKLEATGKEGRAGAECFTSEAKVKQVSIKINDLQEAPPPPPQ